MTFKSAILGGQPAVSKPHQFQCRVPYLAEDLRGIEDLLRQGDLSTHPIIKELEQDYCEFTGRRYGLAHCNGTAALMAAFFALNLKPGDEVIVPSGTFWASVLPMTWLGAVPVFCESELTTQGPDPVHIEQLITERTKAIVMVHLWGMPCQIDEVMAIAGKNQLKVIEDASHAHGALYKGKPCGSFGDISIFSLQGDKLAPGGEGGILLSDHYEYFEKSCCLGDITRIIELESPARRFAATGFGLKTRIAPLSALIAKNTLNRLTENNKIREDNCRLLIDGLKPLGFKVCDHPDVNRVYFELIAQVPQNLEMDPKLLEQALQQEGCLVAVPRYPLLHQQPFFTEGVVDQFLRLPPDLIRPDYQKVELPKTEKSCQQMLALPMLLDQSVLMNDYILAFTKVIGDASEIIRRSDHA